MRFTLPSAYIGPNIYGLAAAIRGRPETGKLEQHTRVIPGEAFRTRLLEQLPGLNPHTEDNKPFPGAPGNR